MLGALLRKDLTLLLKKTSYRLSVVLIVATMAASTGLGIARHLRNDEAWSKWQGQRYHSLSMAKHPWSVFGPGIVQSFGPTPLSIISNGADDLITAPFETRHWSMQGIGYINDRGPIASFIQSLDLSTVLLLILSLVTLFVGHDLLPEEIAKHTYAAALLHGASARQIVLSKYVALWLALLVPAALTYAGCVVAIDAGIGFGPDDAKRAALALVPALLFDSIWIAMILFLQSVILAPRTVVTTSFLVWVALIYIMPQMRMLEARSVAPLSDSAHYYDKVNAEAEALRKTFKATESYTSLSTKSEVPSHIDVNDVFDFSSAMQVELDKKGISEMSFAALQRYLAELEAPSVLGTLSFFSEALRSMATLCTTGLPDFIHYRQTMVDYRTTYRGLLSRNDRDLVRQWLVERKPPEQIMQRWRVSFSRLSFDKSWEHVRGTLATQAGAAVVALLLVLLLGPRFLTARLHR